MAAVAALAVEENATSDIEYAGTTILASIIWPAFSIYSKRRPSVVPSNHPDKRTVYSRSPGRSSPSA